MATTNNKKSSRILLPPSQRIHISFENINYSVATTFSSKEKKPILKGLCGLFKSGELTAIMGPSGAGKSTLLNVLTGFIEEGIEGSIFANNIRLDKKMTLIKNHIAYIMQDDYFNSLFTVEETMFYAADLKLGTSISRKSKLLLIEDILDSMAMLETRNTYCSRLSGGQKKRLNVCLELINNPSIIFLDEPTSGLDSSSCTLLVNKLHGLAKSGRTVICTIHQPSASIFSQFDHLYLVAGGKVVYQGGSLNILPFLNGVGLTCPPYHNPADYVMDVITGEFGNHNEQLITASNNNNWRKSKEIERFGEGEDFKIADKMRDGSQKWDKKPSEWYRYICLVQKILKQLHRDWMVSYLRLSCHIIVSIILGVLYQNYGSNGAKVFSNLSYFFIITLYLSFTSMMPSVLKFPGELKVLKKEHFNNWYKFTTYFLAFLSVHLPVQIIFSSIAMIISYLISGQVLEVSRITLFGIALAFNSVISELIGLSMGTMETPVNGVFNGSILLAVFCLLSGFLLFLKDFPDFMYIFSYLGIFRYVLEILVVSQYGYNRGKLDCPSEQFYCHFRNSEMITQDLMKVEDDSLLKNMSALTIFTVIAGLITFVRARYRLKTFH